MPPQPAPSISAHPSPSRPAAAPSSATALSQGRQTVHESPRGAPKGWRILSEDSALLCSLSKLLGDNHDLLARMAMDKDKSIADLARAINRAESNVSRTLLKLQAVGLIAMESEPGRRGKRPILLAEKTRLCINLRTGALCFEGFC